MGDGDGVGRGVLRIGMVGLGFGRAFSLSSISPRTVLSVTNSGFERNRRDARLRLGLRDESNVMGGMGVMDLSSLSILESSDSSST